MPAYKFPYDKSKIRYAPKQVTSAKTMYEAVTGEKVFSPSVEQQAIFDHVVNMKSGSLVIEAVAGAGKTSTLVELSKRINLPDMAFYCFNVSIKNELVKRLPTTCEVKTINSLGHGALARGLSKELDKRITLNLNSSKYFFIIRTLVKNLGLEPKQEANVIPIVVSIVDFARATMSDLTDESLLEVMAHFNVDYPKAVSETELFNTVRAALTQGELMAKSGSNPNPNWNYQIDFNDQIWLPVKWGMSPSKSQVVMVDEAQDLGKAKLSLVLMALKPGGKIIFVGDRNQCQPAGTMVRMKNGNEKPIESLNVGDEIVTFDRKSSALVKNGIVAQKAVQHFIGNLYAIKTGKKEVKCTPNHKWLVKWNENAENTYVTYLMQQGSRFRVGMTKMFLQSSKGHNFSLASRARQERADAAWIIKTHSTYGEALAYEQVLSAKFGLPEMVFFSQNCNVHYTQEVIDSVYNQLGNQIEQAIACLAFHNRNIQYPFYSKEIQQRQGRNTVFEIASCNLISELMQVPIAPKEIKNTRTMSVGIEKWETITLKTLSFEGPVFSLDVERHHSYISNDIITLNSIYGFCGADSESVDNIIERTNAVCLPLSTSYRCPINVVKKAQTIVPHMNWAEGAIEGIASEDTVEHQFMMKNIEVNHYILCRLTAPLISQCIKFLKEGKPARVKGHDIGQKIVKFAVEVMQNKEWNLLESELDSYREAMLPSFENKRNKENAISNLNDMVEAVKVMNSAYKVTSLESFANAIDSIFENATNRGQYIELLTGHRAKGLEAKYIWVIKPNTLPLRWKNQQEWQLKQEMNLRYVIITRSLYALYFVEDEPPTEIGNTLTPAS